MQIIMITTSINFDLLTVKIPNLSPFSSTPSNSALISTPFSIKSLTMSELPESACHPMTGIRWFWTWENGKECRMHVRRGVLRNHTLWPFVFILQVTLRTSSWRAREFISAPFSINNCANSRLCSMAVNIKHVSPSSLYLFTSSIFHFINCNDSITNGSRWRKME